MSSSGPVIMLGLDATDGRRVEAMVGAGELPNLAALRARGVRGEIRTRPEGFLSMVWPTFFTGQALGAHGLYFNKLWNPPKQRLEYFDPDWLPLRPFYEDLEPARRIALLDIPFMAEPRVQLNGLFLNGWQAHDDFGQHARPRSLWGDLKRRFGPPAMKPEVFGSQSVRTLLGQRDEALSSLDQFGRITADVIERERWDLLVAVFGGAHRGGHYLWSLDEIETSGADPETLELLEDAPRQMYRAWDRALGRVMESAPGDARIMTFSLHGMERNRGWAEYFPRMVEQVHARGEQDVPGQGMVYRMKKALPWKVIRQVTRRLPSSVNHALVPLWSRRMFDWSSTRFFALPVDLNGYVRVNLRGRDAEGIVEPEDYEALLEELTEAFLSFRDLRTDEPIVEAVDRVDEVVGRDAERRWLLPDLVVRWSDARAHGSPGVRSKYGEIRWGEDHRLPSGRSGNHSKRGWYTAAGPGIEPGVDEEVRDAVDLLPTVYRWMGEAAPERFEGRPISLLTHQRVGGSASTS